MLDELNVDIRVKFGKGRKDRGEQYTRTDGWQSEAQKTALQPAQLAKLSQHVVLFRQHGQCAPIDDFTCACQTGRGGFAVQQNDFEFVFELPHRLADGRLCSIDGTGRGGKAALPHHFHECLKAT
ncbi:hypothetical protein D3C80_570890 [compost metagenome]